MMIIARRRFISALALGAAPWLSTAARAASTTLTFVLTNDIYLMRATMMPDGKRRGGFPRLATVVKAERAKGGHVLFTHGGDTLSPSLMSGIDHGEHIITLTNLIPPDIFAPGNHEYDFGKENFLKRMSEARFPLYAANLRGPDGSPLPGFKDRSIVTVDGVRIGLTGATYDGSPRVSSPGDLKFLPTVATMKQQADALRAEGADFVVIVMHADRDQTIELMAANAADLILTGHTHDLFIDFDGRTAAAESSFDGHFVTMIDLEIAVTERDGQRETRWWPRFRIIDSATVTPDSQVAAVVAGFERELGRELDVTLARTDIELDSREAVVRKGEAAIGDLIADAMRVEAKAQVAIMNGGGIRGNKIYPPGSAITRRDVMAELPFGNRLVTLDLKGSELKAAIESGLSRIIDGGGRFPQISGMTVVYDPKRPRGQRVLSITVGGAPLDPDRTYTVATNDYLARGGDGYVAFKAAKPMERIDDSPLLANAVMVYLKQLGTVRSIAGGRLVQK
jgi:2',3'-cyclic-nucleotide 2'-phosphodiesterase (5'-nucleotidase family)